MGFTDRACAAVMNMGQLEQKEALLRKSSVYQQVLVKAT